MRVAEEREVRMVKAKKRSIVDGLDGSNEGGMVEGFSLL